MMEMDSRHRSRRAARLAPAVRAAVTAAPLGFLLAVEKNPQIAGTALYLVLAAGAAAVIARRVPSNRTLALLGGVVAAVAAWLVAQRDDVGAALILAFFFTLGTGMAVEEPPKPLTQSTRNSAIA